MATRYGIQLAVHLISSHFGDLVAKVCECLLRKGTLTLRDIIRFTELSAQQVKNCLLVLIQHNCVQAFSTVEDGGLSESRIITQYMVIFNNIIHRMRFSKFIMIVSQEFDKECEELLEGLLQHGRLTLAQLLDRANTDKPEGKIPVVHLGGDRSRIHVRVLKSGFHRASCGLLCLSGNSFLMIGLSLTIKFVQFVECCPAQDALRESFNRLVNAHYVERCPASEPLLELKTDEAPSRRGAKSAKIARVVETTEQRALKAAAPMEAKRFLVVTNTGSDIHGKNTVDMPSNEITGEKQMKDEYMQLDGALGGAVCEKEVVWRANFEEFVLRLKQKVCVASIRAQYDDGAGVVLSAMLEATRGTERKIRGETSGPLSLNAIFEEVMKTEEGRTMTLEHVRSSLNQIGCKLDTAGPDQSYSIDLKNIIDTAQRDEVELIVLKRYGKEAFRMFRLLSRTRCLAETNKISDTALVDKKEAAKILYKLWQDDNVHMVRPTATSTSDKDLCLWTVNKDTLWKHVLDQMYHGALNLSLRTLYELEQEREILQLPREKRIGELGKRYERLRRVRILMESSLMKLDDSIMLFNDF
ncbi:RNA polymerase III subunit RPC82-related, helix-turn-helix [Dillenia turbinata]|uniref:DNA-directed RNA polymerase III subunit RPC3 n=1 Tax=Dillenia turbinata TaxID=194707 RepID=A0AAN8Z9V7_9MAGN